MQYVMLLALGKQISSSIQLIIIITTEVQQSWAKEMANTKLMYHELSTY